MSALTGPTTGTGPALVRSGSRPTVVGRLALTGLLTTWFLLPLLPLLLWAATDAWPSTARLPTGFGTAGLQAALAAGALPAFGRSLVLAVAVAAIATPLGALAARALAVHRVRGGAAFAILLFAPVALPPFAVVVGLNVVLLRLHLAGPVGVILVLVVYALPYTTFVVRSAYGTYERGYEEEARLLGARPPQVVARVQLPLLLPAIARAAFLAFLVGWSDYLVTLLVAGGRYVTVPLLVASTATDVGDTAVTAVLSLTSILPPLTLLGLLARSGRRAGRLR